MHETLRLASIKRDIACQPRVDTDNTMIEEYAAAMQDGVSFPSIVVFRDSDGINWLADGFYRTAAAESAGLAELDADVVSGSRRDAILFSVGVNAAHGIRRTAKDKERAIKTLLNDPEWAVWSNVEIARKCQVTDKTVAHYRRELEAASELLVAPMKRQISRAGKTYYLDTANLGRKSKGGARTSEHAQEAPDDDMPVREIEDITEQASADKAEDAGRPAGIENAASSAALGGAVADLSRGADSEGHEQNAPGAFARESAEAEPVLQPSVSGAGMDTAAAPFQKAGDDPDVAGNVTSRPDTVTLTRAQYDALVKRASASPWLKVGVPISAIQHCCSLLRSATKAIKPEDAAAQYEAAMFSDDITGIAKWFEDFEQEFRDRFDVGTPAALERDAAE